MHLAHSRVTSLHSVFLTDHAAGPQDADRKEKTTAFLRARQQRFSTLFEDGLTFIKTPPLETSVSLRLGTRLEKLSNLDELKSLWDRCASRARFIERTILRCAVDSPHLPAIPGTATAASPRRSSANA
eukprot:270901-Prymnesium_polylepis.2